MAKVTIRRVLNRVNKEISAFARQSRHAGGLASEGYKGGYRDALNDVLLFLQGVRPGTRGWWRDG